MLQQRSSEYERWIGEKSIYRARGSSRMHDVSLLPLRVSRRIKSAIAAPAPRKSFRTESIVNSVTAMAAATI